MPLECIFCKIAQGKAPAAVLLENEEFMAILDKNPNTPGMTLVIPKRHYPSDIFAIDDSNFIKRLFEFTKATVELLKRGLKVKRVAAVVEGLGINHLHIKLYPLHGLKRDYEEIIFPERSFTPEYLGYITTKLGPERSIEELKTMAEKIRKEAGL